MFQKPNWRPSSRLRFAYAMTKVHKIIHSRVIFFRLFFILFNIWAFFPFCICKSKKTFRTLQCLWTYLNIILDIILDIVLDIVLDTLLYVNTYIHY